MRKDPLFRQKSVADPGEAWPPSPVKISHKKTVAEGGRIDFMFLSVPPPPPAAPSLLKIRTFRKKFSIGIQ